MVLKQVEAVWVWEYNVTAQKAVYGRFTDNPTDSSFTKDYLQASGPNGALLASMFPAPAGSSRFDLTYRWPLGSKPGFLKFSVDRQHLSWATGTGGPLPWRLAASPTDSTAETFPGDPSATTQRAAEVALRTYRALGLNGVLVAVKLVGELDTLHIRAYLDAPPSHLAFASTMLLPASIRPLSVGFTKRKACQSTRLAPGSVYFDPDRNHDSWAASATAPSSALGSTVGAVTPPVAATPTQPLGSLERAVTSSSDDQAAESFPYDPDEEATIEARIETGDFSVPDSLATVKTRGSAQRAFAKKVKANYGNRCAITGISTTAFLVASHIVPWSEDESIRTDPANGICLSTLADRAFDSGFISIGPDCVVTVHFEKIVGDDALKAALLPYDGVTLSLPATGSPNPDYLTRRLGLS